MEPTVVEHNGNEVVPLWVNGAALKISSDRIFPIVTASTNKVTHYAQSANAEEAIAAADAAKAAFPAWSKVSYLQRRQILFKFADLLEANVDEIVKVIGSETSSDPIFPGIVVPVVAGTIRDFGASIHQAIMGSIPPTTDDLRVLHVKRPVGPVMIISTWNSPIFLTCRSLAAALAAGCTVVLKASENCPRLCRLIVALFEQAGLPKGVLNQIVANRPDAAAVTEAVIAHPAIKKIEFIGSDNIGRIVGQLAAKHLKPTLMELGGKNPTIILKDANLQRAANLTALGAFNNHGQLCLSVERIIVVKEVADEFLRLLKHATETNWSQRKGSGGTKAVVDRARGLIDAAVRNGAELVIGDNSYVGSEQSGLRPTVVKGVKPTDDLYEKESFGPSSSFFVVEDDEAAVELANNTPYGLLTSIWTNDTQRALELTEKLDFGLVHINGSVMTDTPFMAFQGWKSSGWGSTNAPFGIEEWLHTKTITLRSPNSNSVV